MTKKRVLLIDDDSDDCFFFQTVAESLDIPIDFSYSLYSHAALVDIQNSSTPIMDILFLDWNMPIISGSEFLRNIRGLATYKNVPIVIYTTSNSGQDKNLAMELGASAFLTKPNNIKDLARDITNILSEFSKQDLS